MRRLYVFCEGATEQGFCSLVLQPHLFPGGAGTVHTLATGRKGASHVHGLTSYAKLCKFMVNTIKQCSGGGVYFTSMFDLYALPVDFPGRGTHTLTRGAPGEYASKLESELAHVIDRPTFIPYLQVYEYETMLFAAPEAFAQVFENADAGIRALQCIAEAVPSIEQIDDGPATAPSKRIADVFPAYTGRKASAGPDLAARIGVAAIREKCAHFDAWLSRLEALARSAPTD